ncbi:MupA/Atu3671 family FMN-dependent luciferase-like monooxygenase [Streptomyces sp. WMMC897]|uniref:MupA/Atu3671 family FMN-dependent luciferase-like monooxygenase n=1 Tax=Streptomyces sp. WMMC897 TaxID=3014782 RepID=UPI0022B71346|nr:MupA/Atu3671 family FMN-dependent luciferase-like monooxygenase [Streptomyces sp. WMMC897]MCZ7413946.1 amino acid adenylation domain-containing protein [Streptomyces sp. WMMC897]
MSALDEVAELSARIEAQLARLHGTAPAGPSPATPAAPPPSSATPAAPPPSSAAEAEAGSPPVVHGPRVSVPRDASMAADGVPGTRAHLADVIQRFTARTARSKELAQRHRRVLADSRATVGFRSSTKEMLYPLAAAGARGPRLTDVDGNDYVDITMGFGTLLFGHEPEFLTEALREHLACGLRLGPRGPEAGEAAELLASLTGMERVAFATSGTEANASAIRLARAATGRDKIVVFHGAYHGHADATLGRGVVQGGERTTVALSPGIAPGAMSDLIVLDYGDDVALEVIAEHAEDIAAVLVEPVQSRRPSLRPVDFVRRLRELTARRGIVLLFDEMLTGLRPHPRGAQELYGVVPDLATYGKLLGGGYPVGAIAGRADLLDGVDGGAWSFGDDSYPARETTFFGGTYLQHPLVMTAARAVLGHLTEQGPALQERLNARTREFADSLNRLFAEEEFPLRVAHFGSMFRFEHRANMELLYHHLILKGVYVWEWRNFFFSTAHDEGDIARVHDAVVDSLRELRAAGFFPRRTPPATAPVAPGTARAASAPAAAAGRDAPERPAPELSLYFFGDYPQDDGEAEGATAAASYETITEAARFADRAGFHALWLPERHFHSFGGLFPNPSVLAAALARETERIRLNAGSVVLPLHDPVRVAEEWSVVDNLSGGRVGIGCAQGWNARDFVFFPERFGAHRELMYEQAEQVRELWRGGTLRRRTGDGEADITLYPRPVQHEVPLFTAIVGNPESYERAARHDLGVVTNLMGQSPEQLAENVGRYRRARAAAGLDPDAGHVAVLLHTYLDDDQERARTSAYRPLLRYMRSSLSLFGQMTSSLGGRIDLGALSESDLEAVFSRAYERYCDQRALIGTPESCRPVIERLRAAGVDEVAALVDFGVSPRALLDGLPRLDALRRAVHDASHDDFQGDDHREAGRRPEERESVRATGTPAPVASPPVPPEPREGPLSPGQQRVWISQRTHPGGTGYNEAGVVRLDGELDVPALRQAFARLVDRHGALRTVFATVDGEPRQRVRPPGAAGAPALPELIVEDAAGRAEADVAREALAAEGAHRFDLERGPLWRVRLLRLAERRHLLVLGFHHIVVDAASLEVFSRDLSALYRAALTGGPAELPAPGTDYVTHAARLRAELGSARQQTDLAYWRDALRGAPPVLSLPTDRPRPEVPSSRGSWVRRELDPELADAVRALARGSRVTPFMTLLAGCAALLGEVSGQRDLVVGTPVSERPEDCRDTIGFFLNTLALRLDLTGDPSFRDLLTRVRRTTLDAYDHAAAPFDAVVRATAARRDVSRSPVFQVLVEYETGEPFALDLPGVSAEAVAIGADKALVDLAFYLTASAQGIGCRLEYQTDLFDEETASGLLARLDDVLRRAVAAPDAPLSALRGVLHGPRRALPATTVDRLVAEQAAAHPDRPAVLDADGTLGYGRLLQRAERLRRRLPDPEPDSDAPVALWLPRSAALVTAQLAVLRSGRAFLPLDPGLGAQRVSAVLRDSGARLLLTHPDAPPVPDVPEPVAVLSLADETGAAGLPDRPPADPDPDRAACVIYTSGSEGTPKGVVVTHRGLLNMVRWQHRRFGTDANARAAMVCSQSFDAALLEVWPALTAGASLAVAGDDVRLDPRALARWYGAREVTFAVLPTALAEQLLSLPDDRQPRLRHLATGGDALRVRPPAAAPYETVNIYGPTEGTVLVTAHTVAPRGTAEGPVPIGRPIDNTRLHVLDADGRPVAPGERGELHLTGAGVAAGYHRDPARTARRFRTRPDLDPDVLYATGDLVSTDEQGRLLYHGRLDDQVKIRGFRVEPAEASHALRSLPSVADGAVLGRKDGRGESVLAGYVVPPGPRPADPAAFLAGVERELSALLPDYLVPRSWALLETLPLNANGKLDRAALPEARVPRPDGTAGRTAPEPVDATARLRKLWAAELDCAEQELEEDASFFTLGGDSLGAIRLAGRVSEEFGTDYPVVEFLRRPTLRAMRARVTDDAPGAGRVRGAV